MRLRLLSLTAALGLVVFTSDVRACCWCCWGGSYSGGYYSAGSRTYGGYSYYPTDGAVYTYSDPAYGQVPVVIRSEKPASTTDNGNGTVTSASATITDAPVSTAGYSTTVPTYVVPAGYSSSYYVPTYYTTPGYYYRGYYYPSNTVYYPSGDVPIRGYYSSPGWYSTTPYYNGWGSSYYGGGWRIR